MKEKSGKSKQATILEEFVVDADAGDAAIAINDYIYLSKDMGDVYMVVTDEGNVAINTGFPGTGSRHKARLSQADSNAIKYIILTQCHANQFGGAMDMRYPETKIIAQQRYPECRHYWRILHEFYSRRSNKLWGEVLGNRSKIKEKIVEAELDILFEDRYEFSLGGRNFELLATPGGESRDSLVVWLPQDRVLFTGNLFGPIFGHMPNLYSIRGDKIRSALAYINSLQRVKELKPELILTGHGKPVSGCETIQANIDRLQKAVQYIHDKTIEGMNEGKDVYSLMAEINLPDGISVGQGHGKVSWCVRAIWEEYAGWFHYDSTAALYPSDPMSIAGELVTLAGGVDSVAARANYKVQSGDPLQGVRLADIALEVDPSCKSALQAKLAAHEVLLEKCEGNFSEDRWLRSEIKTTKARLSYEEGLNREPAA
jgi:alkyl sulfatase BDS1-like metallo-beta-lactamase superfamily hydrolase